MREYANSKLHIQPRAHTNTQNCWKTLTSPTCPLLCLKPFKAPLWSICHLMIVSAWALRFISLSDQSGLLQLSTQSETNSPFPPLSLSPCYDNRHASNHLPADDDILLSRWKTPVSAAYFKPSVQPLSAHVFDTKVDIWSAIFFFSPQKRRMLIETYFTLWDISSLRKSRWMTGTPVGPLSGHVIAP